MEATIDSALLTQIRVHAGCPVPPEALEIVWSEAEKDAKSTGKPLEFALAEKVKALWAEANQKRFDLKPVDFEAFCKARIAKNDSLFSKLLGRKSKVQQALADVEAYEAEIEQAKAGLRASSQKVVELKNDIESTERELLNHDDSAVNESIAEADRIWHLKHRSTHNASKVDAAIAHAVEAEIVNRILNERLIYLRDLLAKEEAKVEAFKRQLKDLEKQG